MKSYLFVITLLALEMALPSNLVFAQEFVTIERNVKVSGNFFWGEGFSVQKDEAKNNAERELTKKMVLDIEEIKDFRINSLAPDLQIEFKSVKSKELLPVSSSCTYRIRRDNSWQALCFIDKSQYRDNITLKMTEIVHRHLNAIEVEKNNGLNTAISIYAENWLETRYLPFDTYLKLIDNEMVYDDFLVQKLETWSGKMRTVIEKWDSINSTLDDGVSNIELSVLSINDEVPLSGIFVMEKPNLSKFSELVEGKVNVEVRKTDDLSQKSISMYFRPKIPDYSDLRVGDIEILSIKVELEYELASEPTKIAEIIMTDQDTNQLATDSDSSLSNVRAEYSSAVIGVRSENPFINELIDELLEIDNSDILKKWLDSQVRVNNLEYSTVYDGVHKQSDLIIALVNPSTKKVHAILSQEVDGERVVLGKGKKIKNPSEEFRGMGVGPIWIHLK